MDSALIPSVLNVPQLLRQHGLSPRKSLGQNFLIDPNALEHVVDCAHVSPEDEVLEIGAGLGSLTRFLAASARRVVAVEIDQNLVPVLREVMNGVDNVHIVHADILKQDPSHLMGQDGYLVIANIPYYITSAIIRHLLESKLKPRRLVLTIQKEVAQRICAQPGDLSLLALSVQVFGRPEIAARIPAGAFYPPPRVDSAVIRIDLYPQPLIAAGHLDTFFQLAHAGFGQKRKMLRRSLSAGLSLPASEIEQLLTSCQIDPTRRAETLSLAEWKCLTDQYLLNQLSSAKNDPQK